MHVYNRDYEWHIKQPKGGLTLPPTECRNPAFGITQRHEMYLKFNVEYLYFAELSTFSYFILDSQLFFRSYFDLSMDTKDS
jgi:hypothetical protein